MLHDKIQFSVSLLISCFTLHSIKTAQLTTSSSIPLHQNYAEIVDINIKGLGGKTDWTEVGEFTKWITLTDSIKDSLNLYIYSSIDVSLIKEIRFTKTEENAGANCEELDTSAVFDVKKITESSALIDLKGLPSKQPVLYYICACLLYTSPSPRD